MLSSQQGHLGVTGGLLAGVESIWGRPQLGTLEHQQAVPSHIPLHHLSQSTCHAKTHKLTSVSGKRDPAPHVCTLQQSFRNFLSSPRQTGHRPPPRYPQVFSKLCLQALISLPFLFSFPLLLFTALHIYLLSPARP